MKVVKLRKHQHIVFGELNDPFLFRGIALFEKLGIIFLKQNYHIFHGKMCNYLMHYVYDVNSTFRN